MALTYTPEPQLGMLCPDFSLTSVDGRSFRRDDFVDAKALLVMFICNHCPYVKAIEDRLISTARELGSKGVRCVAICANDASDYPEDRPEALLARWREKNYGFPYLVDSTQAVARAFGAVCTPDFFVFDENLELAYRGRLDDSWRDPARVTAHELADAANALLAGHKPSREQRPAMGCSIKWREPHP